PALPLGTRELALGSVRQPLIPLAELSREVAVGSSAALPIDTPLAPQPRTEHDATTAERRVVMPLDPPRPSPNVIARAGVHRVDTVLLRPDETRRILEVANQHGDAVAEPQPPPPEPLASFRTTSARTISASYLRSGRWVPLRIGALSLKGAALMAVALPRVDDRVDVALAYAQHRALVRGAVSKVSTMKEAETSGATMFSVDFELDDGARRQLTALLTAARAANITIKPAPPRSTRRYPVEWPVCLGTTRGAVRAEALDVSSDGMFVKPVHALALDAHVTFSAVLDDSLPPVSGHARVVRNIAEADAKTSGLVPGYGLAILEMTDLERDRWSRFLSRVAKRATKRVLIAASAARFAELETGLVAGGYATTGGTEPGAIAQLVSAETRPVDAALIDATWLVAEGSTLWVESVFTARGVPYVTVHGDARRARMAIDRLLAVA
ncbi:MAG TPA: PilZ domain-containing protein, partial [Kofleriaceae bacterium]